MTYENLSSNIRRNQLTASHGCLCFVLLSWCEHFINCNKKSNVSNRNTTSQIMIYRNKCPCNFCYLCSWNPVLSCKCQSAKCKTCLYLTSFGLLVLSNCEMIYNIKSRELYFDCTTLKCGTNGHADCRHCLISEIVSYLSRKY